MYRIMRGGNKCVPPRRSGSNRPSSASRGEQSGPVGTDFSRGGRGGGGGSSGGRHHQRRGGRGGDTGKQAKRRTAPLIRHVDFQTDFHAKLCRAARYKVHAPLCSCPKVAKLRAAVEEAHTSNNSSNNNNSSINNSSTRCAYSNEEVQFDVGGSITHGLSRLKIASPTGEEGPGHDQPDHDPFDNLIVVPDTKSTPAIYICRQTDQRTFRREGAACERTLASQIFGPAIAASREEAAESGHGHVPPFKVNCAICLLATHQRNGFVAIVSRSREELQHTVQRARDAAADKLRRGGAPLHADHAHFVCALDMASLHALLAAGKTRTKDAELMAEIAKRMAEGGLDLPEGMTEDASSHGAAASPSVQIKLGHHLASLLWLLPRHPAPKGHDDEDARRHPRYVMVLGYVDGPRRLELDLPGGKRHLGETTLQGAVREVEEECSLLLDGAWLAARVSERYGGQLQARHAGGGADVGADGSVVRVMEPKKVQGRESGDAFFLVPPPPL